MKMVVEVELGNADMTMPTDVIRSLTVALINQTDAYDDLVAGQGGALRDNNGNTVGKWEVVE